MRMICGWMMVVGVLSLPVWGQQTDEGTMAAIRALEHEWVEGQSHNDNRILDLIFDNALVYVEYGKLVSKGEYLARVKRESATDNQIVLESVTVRTFGSTAISVGTYRERQMNPGRSSVVRWRFVDTWVYEKNGWVLVAAASAPVSVKP